MAIVVKQSALEKASQLGIDTTNQETLERMVKYCAPHTHPKGNCRYEDYILFVSEDILYDIDLISVCPDCLNDSKHCLTCDSTGYLK